MRTQLTRLLVGPLLCACTAGQTVVDDKAFDDNTPSDDSADPSEDPDTDTDTDIEEIGEGDTAEIEQVGGTGAEPEPEEEGWPRACSDVYDPDTVPTFDLTFTEEDLLALRRDCSGGTQSYHPAQFTYGDETVDAMVRLKGNWSWSCDKFQFVISFNEVDPDARFHGLRKIMLDAPWYDRTLLHERAAFTLFENLGLPYSCVNNAELTINGEPYGVYVNVERIDREYLERNFEEPDGNLYQGGSELKTNEDVGDTSRLTALQSARSVDEIAALMDLDQAVAEWAAEAMLPALDNYWAGVEINYYLYDHPSRGFVYLPYDLDISFGDSAYTDGSLVWPDAVNADPITYEHYGWGKEQLMKTVLADPAWCERFVEELELAWLAWSPDEMADKVAEWEAQIAEGVAADTRKHYSTAAHTAAIADMKAFFGERAEVVGDWLDEGDHCPARW